MDRSRNLTDFKPLKGILIILHEFCFCLSNFLLFVLCSCFSLCLSCEFDLIGLEVFIVCLY